MTPRMLANMANCTSVIMLLLHTLSLGGGEEERGETCGRGRYNKPEEGNTLNAERTEDDISLLVHRAASRLAAVHLR